MGKLPLLFWSFLVLLSLVHSIALKCSDHPVNASETGSVMAYAWKFHRTGRLNQANYHPRYTGHTWAPREHIHSTKYANLDWFWAFTGPRDNPRFVRLYLQRPAKVYITIAYVFDRRFPEVTLQGWKSEGYALRVHGPNDVFTYGVHQKLQMLIPTWVHVFSKQAVDYVDLPQRGWLKKNVQGVRTNGDWFVMLAEADGSPPKAPINPTGITETIAPNTKCPDSLHDRWVTKNTDDDDVHTQGKMWRTWHPMWDPCYWCAYDHEHGSAAEQLMGYAPKFEYTAYKNNREDENHHGFKGMVLRVGEYFMYWSIHAQTSNLLRTQVRLHTITLAVTNATTKELLVEVSHKGFFGFLAVRAPPPKGFIPLTPEEEKIRDELHANNFAKNKRSINAICRDDLNPNYLYRRPEKNLLRGQYEDWTTGPLCAEPGHRGMIRVDFTNPITGFKSVEERDEKVLLGGNSGRTFIRNDGSSRIVILSNFLLSEDNCMFKLANIKGGHYDNGVFYTDVTGTTIVDGPGETSIRQFLKPGFELKLDGVGVFQAESSWLGLFEKGARRGLSSYGFPVDPDIN